MIDDYLQDVVETINRLKKDKNAVILAHNYQLGEVQDIADFVGDSLELSRKAANIEADVVVFCGVRFMAETAKILSPQKKVLFPVPEAGCPMADMADLDGLRKFKAQHPGAVTVCYVNSTAAVKTECDLCCTSANADNVINSIPEDNEIIFLPDKNLGQNTADRVGREMILWPGYCPTHMRITKEMLLKKKSEFPDAIVMVHPECRPDVVALADVQLSTGGMIKFVKESDAKQIIVGTEMGIIHRLEKEAPDKVYVPISEQAVCMNMKMITLADVLHSLESDTEQIEIPADVIEKAVAPIQKMLDLSAAIGGSK